MTPEDIIHAMEEIVYIMKSLDDGSRQSEESIDEFEERYIKFKLRTNIDEMANIFNSII